MDRGIAFGDGNSAFLVLPDPALIVKVREPKSVRVSVGVSIPPCIPHQQETSAYEKPSIEEALGRIADSLPSVDNFISTLDACRRSKKVACAEQVFIDMCDNGVENEVELGNSLVPIFVKCGYKKRALQIFNRLTERNVKTWHSLIQDYVDCGEWEDALKLYQQMKGDHLIPNSYMVVALLQACGRLESFDVGYELHDHAIKYGLSSQDAYVRSSLVDFYGKCGFMTEAQALFDKQPEHDLVSFTALIAGYAKDGAGDEALKCFELMDKRGISPNAVTFVCCLKASVYLGALEKGQELYYKIVKDGYEQNIYISSSLIDMYVKFGLLADAQEMFNELQDRDVVCWTALIAGYVDYGLDEEALGCLEQMASDGVPQNAVTITFGLKACAATGATGLHQILHTDILKAGFDKDFLVSNTLVDTYAKWGFLAEAWITFNQLWLNDVASWNALMAGYAEHGLGEEVLDCFWKVQAEGLFPDAVTYIHGLKSCASIGALENGRELHLRIVKEGLDTNLCVGCSVLDMYMKLELSVEAWEVFVQLPVSDVVSWTAVITGYTEEGSYEEALECMKEMQVEGVVPNAHTYASGVKACGGLGVVEHGQELHGEAVKLGYDREIFICNGLVDMYASVGCFLDAEAVFDQLVAPDVVSWNVLMGGYQDHARSDAVLECFKGMQQQGVPLNAVTCILVLKACVSLGLIERGQEIHTEIVKERLERDPFVSSCLVDMYSKCGLLSEAWDAFSELPVQDVVSWTALIGGLIDGGFAEEGLRVFEKMQHAAGVAPDNATYACILKSCGTLKALDRGRRMHIAIVEEGLDGDIFLGVSLIDMYAKLGLMFDARNLFDDLLSISVVPWTALMAGYNRLGLAKEALTCLEQMKLEVLPNAVTFACSLKACASVEALSSGQRIHDEIVKEGYEADLSVVNHLVYMYAKCGVLKDAEELFEGLPYRELMSYTALMEGRSKQGHGKENMALLEQLQVEGISFRRETWPAILQACGLCRMADLCHELHMVTIKVGFDTNISVHRTLVDMYVECGVYEEVKGLTAQPSPYDSLWLHAS